MRSINHALLLVLTLIISFSAVAQKSSFSIVTANTKASVVYDSNAPELDSIAANLLADDIERVTSYRPKVITDISKATGNVIVIGSIQSALIQKFVSNNATFSNKLQGKWECFALTRY